MVGMLGGWDQQRFRQTVVERSMGVLRWSRPFYNRLASCGGGLDCRGRVSPSPM